MLYLLLLVSLRFSNCATSTKLLPLAENATSNAVFLDTLLRIYEEEAFNTILVLGEATNPCFSISDLVENIRVPLIIATASASEDKLKDRFNSNIIAIVCLSAKRLDLELLKVLATKLQHRRQTRTILQFAAAKPTPSWLDALTAYCEEQYMTNVIGFFGDLQTYFYRYYPFPTGLWRLELLNSTQCYFPSHQRDLQGKTFVTLPGQIVPRGLIYVDSAGRQHLSGYVLLLMLTFAKKHNITLQYLYPVIPGELVHLTVLLEFVRNGSLDVAMTLVPASYSIADAYWFLTYPLELSGWFIVLPCPRPLDYFEIYTIVVTTQVVVILILLNIIFSVLDSIIKHQFYKSNIGINWTDILVNENIIRGIFGLSFFTKRHPVLSLKMLYVFLFLLGLFVNNMYSAYIQTLFTSPPLHQKILTFDDMRDKKLVIMFDRKEISFVKDSLGSDFNRTFKDILRLEDTETFQRHRREYDTTYAYAMPESLWSIVEAQQETFEGKLYCLAPTLKFFGLLLLGIPLAENSYILEPLNTMTLRVIETGLLEHWHTVTFLDMIASGQLLLAKSRTREKFHNINIQDMQLPFYLLLCGLSVGGAVSIAELCLYKLKNKQQLRK